MCEPLAAVLAGLFANGFGANGSSDLGWVVANDGCRPRESPAHSGGVTEGCLHTPDGSIALNHCKNDIRSGDVDQKSASKEYFKSA